MVLLFLKCGVGVKATYKLLLKPVHSRPHHPPLPWPFELMHVQGSLLMRYMLSQWKRSLVLLFWSGPCMLTLGIALIHLDKKYP